jgi:large subunit ribosomal protein L17
MRHQRRQGKLGRTSAHRSALLRNLVTSLLDHERLETTHAKARELRRVADRMVTLGKRGDLHARRLALSVIRDKDVAAKLFGELAERYRERPGGYTRVLKLRRRVGDAAPVSLVELVGEPVARAAAGKPAKGKAKPGRDDKGAKAEKGKAAPKAKAPGRRKKAAASA